MTKGAIRNAASKKYVSSTTVNIIGCYSFYALFFAASFSS